MKTTILCLAFTFFAITNFYAQTTSGLELHFKSKTPKYELYKELWLEAYLINKSKTTIRLFKIGFSEPGWDGYNEKWEGTINGNPMTFSFFRDAPSSKFRTTSIVEVLPGDSIYAGLLRYDMKAPGKYKIIYTLSQDPAKVRMGYAASPEAAAKAKQISTYSVTSKPFEFVIEDIQMGAVQAKEISAEELKNKPMVYDIETAFANPSDVYKLTVSGNVTKEVMSKVCLLKNLKVLCLTGIAGLESFPEELGQLKLDELSLIGVDKIKLPASMSKLQSLTKLFIDYMSYTELPAFVVQLKNLEVISVRNTPLTSVPDAIENLKQLKELMLVSTEITTLNPKVSTLSALEKLTVSEKLTSFPAIFGCKNLKYLELSYNKGLTVIPAEIGQLTQLVDFQMAITSVSAIPKEIANLKNLKVLHLNYNKLTEIPATLYECTALEKVDFSYNQISVAAPGIDKLVNLKEFVAYENKLEALPVGLSKCPNIERVWVHTNKISRGDDEGKALEKKIGKQYCYNCYKKR